MNWDLEQLQEQLCKSLCQDIRLHPRSDGRLYVETPFVFADGDAYALFLEQTSQGLRLTDCGHTLMHMSYDFDVDKLQEGTRGRIWQQIIRQAGLQLSGGELFVDTAPAQLGQDLIRFGQALTKVTDLTFLNRIRVESTFYDDLHEVLEGLVPGRLERDYIHPDLEDGRDYPIDYRVLGASPNLFIFGVPNQAKARLVTITLEHLLRRHIDFDSLVIFANQQEIPRPDLARLSNAAGEMVSSLDAAEDISRKVRKLAA